jgi:glycine cleavage system aminomethyltransferase T
MSARRSSSASCTADTAAWRKTGRIVLDGESVPIPGATIRADDGRDVGRDEQRVVPALKRPIALAYLQRDFVAPGTAVSVDGSRAVVTEVPFVPGRV